MDKSASLRPEVTAIITAKGTEPPGSGEYNTTNETGTYLCRSCGLALFRSTDKFLSSCGWPSFDNEIPNSIARVADQDGQRTEIVCQRCEAHLGHVFIGEYLTQKNLRHCVNSLSVDFVHSVSVLDSEELIVAGGCFWGGEHLLKQVSGVISTEVGYTGGHSDSPSYNAVCRGDSGHYEAVRVVFDVALTTSETVMKAFFEAHNPFQADGQGPDRGEQYRSAVFYYNDQQKEMASQLVNQLALSGSQVATQLLAVGVFWPAELSHQDYIDKHPATHCHTAVKRF